MRLTKRAIASRQNGALSHGPKTPEGKRRSAANSLRHGLLAKTVLLDPDTDSHTIFAALHDQFIAKFDPADGAEHSHVEEMVAAVWQERRLWTAQTRLLQRAIDERQETDTTDRLALALQDLARDPSFALLLRYEARLQRRYDRALKHLFEIGEPVEDPGLADPDAVLPPALAASLRADQSNDDSDDLSKPVSPDPEPLATAPEQTNLDSDKANQIRRVPPTSETAPKPLPQADPMFAPLATRVVQVQLPTGRDPLSRGVPVSTSSGPQPQGAPRPLASDPPDTHC